MENDFIHFMSSIDVEDMNIIKDCMKLFKKKNPEQQGTSCIYHMKTRIDTLQEDLKNHIFYDEIYDEKSQQALRKILYVLLTQFMLDYPNNGIEFESWINMLYFGRKDIYDEKFHDHYSMNKANNRLIPDKSLVLYIQMPNNLNNNDGVLFYKLNDKLNEFLPNAGDVVVMDSKVSHVPNIAPSSTIDRIILGLNIKIL